MNREYILCDGCLHKNVYVRQAYRALKRGLLFEVEFFNWFSLHFIDGYCQQCVDTVLAQFPNDLLLGYRHYLRTWMTSPDFSLFACLYILPSLRTPTNIEAKVLELRPHIEHLLHHLNLIEKGEFGNT